MIRVVLHEPQELVNIAQVVRAMKNFGFGELVLVSPREFDAWRIEGIAHRSEELVSRLVVAESLRAALGDCVHVVAFTARERTAKRSIQRPRDAAAEIRAREGAGPVALVFGREDTGLPNQALDLCHRAVVIPTDPSYPSLNLSHAVALMLYELALAAGAEARPHKPPRRRAPPAPVELLEMLFGDVERALDSIDFFKTRRRELILRSLREIAHRTPLDEREAKLLRALAIESAKRTGSTPRP